MAYSLFDSQILKEWHFTFLDGAFNERHIWVLGFNFTDALSQAREKAISHGYMMPFKFIKGEQLNGPP